MHLLKLMLLTLGFAEDKGDEKRKADDGHFCGRTPTAKMAPLKRMPEMSWMPMSILKPE